MHYSKNDSQADIMKFSSNDFRGVWVRLHSGEPVTEDLLLVLCHSFLKVKQQFTFRNVAVSENEGITLYFLIIYVLNFFLLFFLFIVQSLGLLS